MEDKLYALQVDMERELIFS